MEVLLYLLLFTLGASWGSFLHVVAIRIEQKSSFITGRSHCVACGNQLTWYELIPVFSWIFLRGKCRSCHTFVSPSYVLTECVTGGLFILAWYMSGSYPDMLFHLLTISFFVVLFLLDFKAYIVPDIVSIPAMILMGVSNMLRVGAFESIILGALAGATWFFVQYIISKGRWVGDGDIRLGALMGVLVGHPYIWLALFVSYIAGSVVAMILMLVGKKTFSSKLPFGTLLLPSAYIVWLYGPVIWDAYLQILGVA